ncbi:MAG: BsaWI family type II restriction enzyme [Methanoregula sp.]|jgi:hypothetical protein
MNPKKLKTKEISSAKGSVNEHQSYVSRSGNEFQNEIYKIIFNGLNDNEKVSVAQPLSRITATPPNKEHKSKRFACLEIHTPRGSIIGDTDIVIFNKKQARPACIVSCKTSLHSRNTESLYYARLYRDMHGKTLPFFFVTKDKTIELGSVDNPTKPRVLFEYENISVYSTNPKTQLGGCIKSISQLIPDLKRIC